LRLMPNQGGITYPCIDAIATDGNTRLTMGIGGSITILANGNIGIGTNSPQQILDVNGSLVIRTANSGIIGTQGLFFRDGCTVSPYLYNCSILTYDHSGDNFPDGLSINGVDGISFCTGANTRNERMRLDINGYLNVGSSTSTTGLRIAGWDYGNTIYQPNLALPNGNMGLTVGNPSASINFSCGNGGLVCSMNKTNQIAVKMTSINAPSSQWIYNGYFPINFQAYNNPNQINTVYFSCSYYFNSSNMGWWAGNIMINGVNSTTAPTMTFFAFANVNFVPNYFFDGFTLWLNMYINGLYLTSISVLNYKVIG